MTTKRFLKNLGGEEKTNLEKDLRTAKVYIAALFNEVEGNVLELELKTLKFYARRLSELSREIDKVFNPEQGRN